MSLNLVRDHTWTIAALIIFWIVEDSPTAYALASPAKIVKEFEDRLADSFDPQVPYYECIQGNGSNLVINGVGAPVRCRGFYNAILNNTSEFDKLASAVATTVMTLVPAFLSFGPLPSAKLESLIYFNAEITFFTAAMTLGLYNSGLTTLAKNRMLSVKALITKREDIESYGNPRRQDLPVVVHTSAPAIGEALVSQIGPFNPQEKDLSAHDHTMRNLQRLYSADSLTNSGDPPAGLSDPLPLALEINREVLEGHKQRPKRSSVMFMTIGFSIAQHALFGSLFELCQ